MTKVALLVVGVLCACSVVRGWINDVDQPANFTCKDGQMVNHIVSEFSGYFKDRRWDFGCIRLHLVGSVGNCQWSGYVNEFDEVLNFQCPGEGFVTGIDSYHNSGPEDRRFKFHCCELQGATAHGCYFTGWENRLGHLLDYTVPAKRILRGVESFHSNTAEDRRFKFNICEYEFLEG